MQVEFRDGIREVPDYLAILMKGLPTYEMTYEEAREKANWRLASDYANRVQRSLVRNTLRSR